MDERRDRRQRFARAPLLFLVAAVGLAGVANLPFDGRSTPAEFSRPSPPPGRESDAPRAGLRYPAAVPPAARADSPLGAAGVSAGAARGAPDSVGLRVVAFRELTLRDAPAAGRLAARRLEAGGVLDPLEGEAMIAALGAWGDRSIAPLLGDLAAESTEPRMRAMALTALVAVDPERALGLAASWAWSEPEPSLRRLGVRLVGRIDDPLARATLEEIASAETDLQIVDLARRVSLAGAAP